MKKQLKQKFIKGVLAIFLIYLLPTISFAQLVELEKPTNTAWASYKIESDDFGNVYSVKMSEIGPDNFTWQIRKWNGSIFTALTDNNISYFNGDITSMNFDKNGNLFVVGYFRNSNGQFYIAKWNGNNWSEIAPSPRAYGSVAVNSVGEIFVSRFEVDISANANASNASILKWNGSNWLSIIDTSTYHFAWRAHLEFDKYDNLYLANAYDYDAAFPTSPIFYMAEWNYIIGFQKLGESGTNYPNLYDPYRFPGGVDDFKIGPDNNLYVVGTNRNSFSNNSFQESVLKWNAGGYWSNLGFTTGNLADVQSIEFDTKGNLFGYAYPDFAKYDGTNWTNIDSLNENTSSYKGDIDDFCFDLNNNIFLSTRTTSNPNNYYVYKYFTNPPILNNFTPKLAFKGDAVTISGKNLFGVTSVIFGNDTAQSYQVINDNSLVAIVGNGSSGNIKVVNPAGTTALSGFVFPAPIVQSFDPIKSAKGAIITIKGLNFRDVQKVTFGGIAAKSIEVLNNTTIKATISNVNSGYVSVTTLGGKDSLDGFIFIPAPIITSFTPASANVGETVTIIGSNFNNASSVSFGGYPAKSFIVLSAGTIQAILDSGNTGYVSVVAPGGVDSLAGFIHKSTKTGVEELVLKNVYVYPNPAQDNITIQSEINLIGQSYNIYDCLGKLVLNGAIENQTTLISLQALNNGIYTLVIGANSRKVIKLVKSSSN
jgi:hypothetical protein